MSVQQIVERALEQIEPQDRIVMSSVELANGRNFTIVRSRKRNRHGCVLIDNDTSKEYPAKSLAAAWRNIRYLGEVSHYSERTLRCESDRVVDEREDGWEMRLLYLPPKYREARGRA